MYHFLSVVISKTVNDFYAAEAQLPESSTDTESRSPDFTYEDY